MKINTEEDEIENYDKFNLNSYQLNAIRTNHPKINLYEKPIIGTEEIRQYTYCKRIIYFRHVIKAPMKKSYKMEFGMEKHDNLDDLSKKSPEDYIHKYFNVYLTDPRIGLVGLIDYFEFNGKEAYPVEFKSGNIPPEGLENPHKYQVTAQAMLIESSFDFLVKKVRIYYSKFQKIVDYPIDSEDKLKVLKIIRKIEKIITLEKIPQPTQDKGKCIDCECRIYCEA